MKEKTRIVSSGRHPEKAFGAVNPPAAAILSLGVTRPSGLSDVVEVRHWSYPDYTRVVVDGETHRLEEVPALDKNLKHSIDVVVDRLIAKAGIEQRLTDSVETALRHGEGIVIVAPEGRAEMVLSEHRACHHCGLSFPEPSPQLFSFNSPQGMCPECSGLGTRMEMDPELVVPDPGKSLNGGAVKVWSSGAKQKSWNQIFSGIHSHILERL